MSDQDDQLPDDEIARRMERGIRRFLKTPPQPHGKNPDAMPAPKPKERSVRLSLDASELVAALGALSTELPNCPPEIVSRAIDLGDLPAQLARIEVDPNAAAAGEVAVFLKPSDRLRGLVAAIGAGNAD